ncbi:P2Y purinoceptor 1-like isoform X1 [Simochromis diagramma]|uniref:P2Y purinoceptor 1-like isoform X1 n=1 Tax=Simochromis diagramma TaxID=43689 RepID=UPI001A7E3CEB|nr:P2Y purinoceptor 1-like isoform X1 [Simochromis diagramma]
MYIWFSLFVDNMLGDRMNTNYWFRSVYEHVTLPAIYTFVFIIGLGANVCGLKSLLQKWKSLGHINVFLLNLGIANFLFLPTLPFLTAYYFMENKWIFGDALCKITRFCFNLNLYGSIGFLTCISVNRYLAIVHALKAKRRITVRTSVAISVMVWLLVSAQSLPDVLFPKNSTNETEKCYHTTSYYYVEDYLKYSVGWTLTGFVMPFLIFLGCYGHVTLVLCRKNTINKVVKQKSLKLMFILILLFSVCYIPYHIFKNLSLYSRVLFSTNKKYPSWDKRVFCAHQISRGLVCLNSVLNPLVYLHVMDILAQLQQLLQRFRQTFTRLFVSNYVSVPVAQTANTAIS